MSENQTYPVIAVVVETTILIGCILEGEFEIVFVLI